MSLIAIGVARQQKEIEITSLTLRDHTGNVFAVIDAEYRQFQIYSPNGEVALEIEATEGGTNLIISGKDGFERIRLSTWTSGGSYIHILRDGWQDNPDGAPLAVIHISKDGVKIER